MGKMSQEASVMQDRTTSGMEEFDHHRGYEYIPENQVFVRSHSVKIGDTISCQDNVWALLRPWENPGNPQGPATHIFVASGPGTLGRAATSLTETQPTTNALVTVKCNPAISIRPAVPRYILPWKLPPAKQWENWQDRGMNLD